jgi:hypothetical protein
MALPVNKPTLDKNINDNILLNNNTQFITAKKLQDTLYPIVNSTFEMKTIWAGTIYIDAGQGRNAQPTDRKGWYATEIYFDPNYFAADNPSNIADPLNRYIVTNAGSGLLADNGTPNGTFTNKTVTNLQTVDPAGKGFGLTFNGTITAGVLSSLSVNNPGSGYSYGFESIPSPINPNIYTSRLRLNVTNTGNAPEIKFNLSNAVSIAFQDTQDYANGWALNYFNVFIPNKLQSIGESASVILNWTDNFSTVYAIGNSLSRISTASGNVTIGDLNSGQPGFFFWIAGQSDNSIVDNKRYRGFLEIKVPIINTTLPA